MDLYKVPEGYYTRVYSSPYPYFFSPKQLMTITSSLEAAAGVNGCCVEAGCAYGATTIFLRRFMAETGIRKDYFAIDTFQGFLNEHLDHEVQERGKPGMGDKVMKLAQRMFERNRKEWFDQIVANHDVRSIEADVGTFGFAELGPIAWCLLDVDLYLPTRNALPKIYDALAPGGVIVVDDCVSGGNFDGALQAYTEFVESSGLGTDIVDNKLGIIRKRH